jgi:beta-galactosidase
VELLQESHAEIHLKPRDPLDIPSYTMQDYTLVWSVSGEKGDIIEGGIYDLPALRPGDDPLSVNISWESAGIQKLRADLLDPQHYSVRDTTIHFAPPEVPEIVDVQTASNRMRVVFNHVGNATSYQVFYGKDDFSQKTGPTINDYVEIEDLERFGSYQVRVVALNNAGQSEASTPVRAQLDRDELPPIIRQTVPSDGSFFVGYSVDRVDYMYQVEYGIEPGNYTNRITARTFGVLQVPGLENGKTYYYRIRSRKQQGFDSNWSHEVAVTPDGGLPPGPPVVHGVIRQNNRAYIRLNPVKKALGYQVSVLKDGQKADHVLDNRAHTEYIHVENISASPGYTFIIKTQNKYGLSEPVYVE